MIAPIDWLWKQFRGPQISAIANAIFEYFRATLDPILDYWNRFTIATANSEHLTIIGALQGIARPIVFVRDNKYFWFSQVPEEGTYYPSVPYEESPHGLSSLDNIMVGGKFSDFESTQEGDYRLVSDALYRLILQSANTTKGEQGSLIWLDDMLYTIWKRVQPSRNPTYSFTILDSESPAVTQHLRSIGDAQVDLGAERDWGEDLFAELLAEVNLLGSTIYYPNPTLYATAQI